MTGVAVCVEERQRDEGSTSKTKKNLWDRCMCILLAMFLSLYSSSLHGWRFRRERTSERRSCREILRSLAGLSALCKTDIKPPAIDRIDRRWPVIIIITLFFYLFCFSLIIHTSLDLELKFF